MDYELFADDGISGTKESRPSLDRMMSLARAGELDRIVVYSFSRYARSVTHLLSALEELRSLNVAFTSYTENLDTNSPMGKAFFVIIAAVSQLERDLIVERVKNGLKNAKLKGIHIGRKKTRPSALIRTLRRSGLSYSSIAKITNVSEGAIGVELAEWRQELAQQNRTIADEMTAHANEKLSKNTTSQSVTDASNSESGITISLDEPVVELEFYR